MKAKTRKPSSILVYKILKKYSSFNHRLTRNDIKELIKKDYNIDIRSKDTISAAIEEIGAISFSEFKEESYNDDVVVKCGKTGFFLVNKNKLNFGEVHFLLNSILASKSLSQEESDILINKLIPNDITDSNFQEIEALKKSRQLSMDAFKTHDMNTIEKIEFLNRAINEKLEVSFLPRNINILPKQWNPNELLGNKLPWKKKVMLPLYLFTKNGHEIVLGVEARPNPKPNQHAYVMVTHYLERMVSLAYEDETSPNTSFKITDFAPEIFMKDFIHNLIHQSLYIPDGRIDKDLRFLPKLFVIYLNKPNGTKAVEDYFHLTRDYYVVKKYNPNDPRLFGPNDKIQKSKKLPFEQVDYLIRYANRYKQAIFLRTNVDTMMAFYSRYFQELNMKICVYNGSVKNVSKRFPKVLIFKPNVEEKKTS